MTTRGASLRAAWVAGVVVLGLAAPTHASAETADEARDQARAAAAVVQGIQPRVDAALAAYESSLQDLAGDVSSGISAEQAADQAMVSHDATVRAANQRVRALYMAGGGTGLIASVLEARSPVDLAQRIGNVRRIVDADRRATEASGQLATAARVVAVERANRADTTTATVGRSDDRLRELLALLDEAQRALDSLTERARRLEDAERAAAALAAARASADQARWEAASTATAGGIPVNFLALYRGAAATCRGLPWPVLAAIGQVESGHGSNPNDSYAGAQGPMQFLPSTFAAFAVDGDGDGRADIRNPADAIYSAAKYLCYNHAGRDASGLRGAIFRYNHADWYVAMVLRIAGQIAERFSEPPVPGYDPVAG